MHYVLQHVAGLDAVLQLDDFQNMDDELVSAILDESAKFTTEVLAPLNRVGDEHGSICEDGVVTTPPGWKDAYIQFIEAGWNGLAFDIERGGQGLPWLVATAVQEMWHSANMSFGLCPLLTQSAIRALEAHGSKEQQDLYMPRLISGEWSGTMNLTESHAGTDLSMIRTRAEAENSHYRITGQKIYITYGEHDLTENIIHFVLARCTDSPEGVKGISLFIVPKYLVNADGTLGEKNDIRCVSVENKLGIHASPTAVLSYGDNGGAVGYLVGEKNRGLEYMFTMMNLARHAVGVEGLAIAERAYQQAADYAKHRIQGSIGRSKERVPIVRHPDVRRMLMTMRSLVEAMRCVSYLASAVFDLSNKHPDDVARNNHAERLGILIPLVKGWCAEMGNEVAYLGIQIHGGMGFIEETGAAQLYRDARITPIYEGTTGIQANDLIGRKLLRGDKSVVERLVSDIRSDIAAAKSKAYSELTEIIQSVQNGTEKLEQVTQWVYEQGEKNASVPAAGSVDILHVMAIAVAGWLMMQSAVNAAEMLKAGADDNQYLDAKLVTVRYYATHIMPRIDAHAEAAMGSSLICFELSDDSF